MEDDKDKRFDTFYIEDVAAHDEALSDIDVARLKRAVIEGGGELMCGEENVCSECHKDVGDLYMLEWCADCDGFLHARCMDCFSREVESNGLARFEASETIDARRVTPATLTFVRMRAVPSRAADDRVFFPDMMLFYTSKEV